MVCLRERFVGQGAEEDGGRAFFCTSPRGGFVGCFA